jgi:hypothetical protein
MVFHSEKAYRQAKLLSGGTDLKLTVLDLPDF